MARPRALISLAVCALAIGCTKDPVNTDFSGKSVKLRFMFWGDPVEVQDIRNTLRQFEKERPGLSVDLVHKPSAQYRDSLRVQMLGGDPPDVMYMSIEDCAGFAQKGWITPIDDLVAADKEFKAEDFYPDLYNRFRYRGKLYGVAKDFATLVVYYNKDLFDKWEVPYPQEGWSWDDFLKTSKALTHELEPGAQDDEFGYVLETWAGQWLPWVWQNEGRLMDEDGLRCLLGDPEYLERNAEAIQFLQDLIWKHEVAPKPSTTRDQGTMALFQSGRAAMYTAGRWACMQLKEVRRFDWDVVTMPRGRARATTLFPVCYSIAKDCKEREAAWELVKFLTARRRQEATANSGLAIPTMISVAESEAFTKPKALGDLQINHQANLADIAYSKTPPRLACWPELRNEIDEVFQGVFNNRRTAREALIALQAPLERILEKERRRAPR